MNSIHHKEQAGEKWAKLSFAEQMANIGSEVERTLIWKSKNEDYSKLAAERALELLDLTIAGVRAKSKLKELARIREVFADHIFFENKYSSTDEDWRKYFFSFNYLARQGR